MKCLKYTAEDVALTCPPPNTSVIQLQPKVAVKISRGRSSQSRCDTEQSVNKEDWDASLDARWI